jgi:hypothetical protein
MLDSDSDSSSDEEEEEEGGDDVGEDKAVEDEGAQGETGPMEGSELGRGAAGAEAGVGAYADLATVPTTAATSAAPAVVVPGGPSAGAFKGGLGDIMAGPRAGVITVSVTLDAAGYAAATNDQLGILATASDADTGVSASLGVQEEVPVLVSGEGKGQEEGSGKGMDFDSANTSSQGVASEGADQGSSRGSVAELAGEEEGGDGAGGDGEASSDDEGDGPGLVALALIDPVDLTYDAPRG